MPITKAENIKNSKRIKYALFCVAITVIIAAIAIFIYLNSGAWLSDRGKWSDNNYTVGRIDYSYEINNKSIDINAEVQEFIATIPIVGAVKINDSSAVNISDPNYQKHSEANFNDGVTVARILLDNKSDFDINISAGLTFKGTFNDEANPKDIFYLVLPQNALVDTTNKTVEVNSKNYSYKNYIKECMPSYTTYNDMVLSLTNYYNNNETLTQGNFILKSPNNAANVKEAQLEYYILFWSEYNDKLPFVTGTGSDEKLSAPNGNVDNLMGEFVFRLAINQGQD